MVNKNNNSVIRSRRDEIKEWMSSMDETEKY